jgi:alanine racemase
MRPTRGVIHLENLRWNIRQIRKILGPSVQICMAVKADAYGHGALRLAKTAVAEGIKWFGVATVYEGIRLRREGIGARILLFSLPFPEDIPLLLEYNIIPFVAEGETITRLDTAAEKLRARTALHDGGRFPVHLKIDTGMGRIGCFPDDAPFIAEQIARSSSLFLEGTCTHFPGSDTKDQDFSKQQIALFLRSVNGIRARGVDPGILHTANSGAIIGFPESHFDMVRPGIILYGYYPSREQARELEVRPVFELQTRVMFVKKVPPGTPISYGSIYRTKSETWIATLPVGYADGYPRLLSNNAEVLIRGKTYPVAGRVCMDQIMVDIGSETDIRPNDTAVLFGPDPAGPTAETVAEAVGTIPYEITCGITKRVPRLYVDGT